MVKLPKLFKYISASIILIPFLFLSKNAFGVETVTIKKNQISLVKDFSDSYNEGSSHAQGGIITEKYFIFSSFTSDSKGQIHIVDRKTGKKLNTINTKNLGHMNTFLYDWGKGEAIITGNNSDVTGCIVGLNGKAKNIKIRGKNYKCASKNPTYHNKNKEGKNGKHSTTWRPQGRAQRGEYTMQLWWYDNDSSTNYHDGKIYVYKKSKLIKIFYIPTGVIKSVSGGYPGEIEDISFDKNGDVYLLYAAIRNKNGHGVWGYRTRYYKVKQSVFAKYGIDLKYQADDSSKDNNKNDKGNDSNNNVNNDKNNSDGNKDSNNESKEDCAVILKSFCDDPENGVKNVLGLILDILTYGIGIAAVIGISISGITYLTAKDNEQQTTKAKRRIFEITIGLVAYAALYALLKFLNIT
ncbi:hypothetical protein IJG12_00390 [Candidatus Saccharibacteria bacterium]|nr:hypothetical protein [Candidatus Saccharibacteria bacterium]